MDKSLQKQLDTAAFLSILAYLILAAIKVIVSFRTNSSALLADGLNNVTDIGASLAVFIGIKIARKPRDLDHPYGHSRAEQIATLIASFIMMSVGLQVIIENVRLLIKGEFETPNSIAAIVAFASGIFMIGIYFYNNKIAKKTKSKGLEASAKDNLSDALVSFGTTIGVLGASFGYPIIDPIVAIIVGGIICKTAWEIFYEASHSLTDGFDPDEMVLFTETVEKVPGVYKVVDLRARMYGNTTIADVVIEVDGGIDVSKSHSITDQIEMILHEQHSIQYTHIHVEPKSKFR
ncbi:cation diffusion facilitator family transporter [Bacillus sp. OAE603]|uniref:cation diffusion facilitator family transporter n=1 Tax=Gottfriedia sp. OAE603 TaxID=2663872 RepID=UPI00178985AC